MQNFHRVAKALKSHQASYNDFPLCTAVILAQWAKESDWGRSKLAMLANNFAGLKMRPELRGLAKPFKYTDWENQTDPYCAVDSPEDFPGLYFVFIRRQVYWGIESCQDPESFINHLAIKGFCASTPEIKRQDYADNDSYRAAVAQAYARSVLKLADSDSIKSLI